MDLLAVAVGLALFWSPHMRCSGPRMSGGSSGNTMPDPIPPVFDDEPPKKRKKKKRRRVKNG